MSDELRKAAQDALDALKDRIVRIHTASLDGRPKQAYGEMVYAMTQMPEWDTLRAALAAPAQAAPHARDAVAWTPDTGYVFADAKNAQAAPDDAKQRLLEIMRRNGLATGHGDTIDDALKELDWQLSELKGKSDGTL